MLDFDLALRVLQVVVVPLGLVLVRLWMRASRNEERLERLEKARRNDMTKDEFELMLLRGRETFKQDVIAPLHVRLDGLREDVSDVRERMVRVETKVLNGQRE